MKITRKHIIYVLCGVAMLAWVGWFFAPSPLEIFFRGGNNILSGGNEATFTYATEGQNQIIASSTVTLERILIGSDVTQGDIAIYNSNTAGDDSDLVLYLTNMNASLQGVYELGVEMSNGIMINVSESTSRVLNTTIFYSYR